ncbi:Hypothetical predicted protein, partial [Marmota monax]
MAAEASTPDLKGSSAQETPDTSIPEYNIREGWECCTPEQGGSWRRTKFAMESAGEVTGTR